MSRPEERLRAWSAAVAAVGTRVLWCAALAAAPWGAAEAHTAERAHILILPTDLYIAGGTLVVALSFIVVALVPGARLRAFERAHWAIGRRPAWQGVGPSLAAFALVVALIAAGYVGSRDPLGNPLPLVVWTVWWVGVTFLHALFGNLWARINPWRGPYRLLAALPGLRRWSRAPPLRYPAWLGYWPATAVFFAFAWFELIDPAPQDPARLAGAATVYLGATLAAMVLFGEHAWLRYGEAFSVFFRVVSWLAPFGVHGKPSGRGISETRTLSVTIPGRRLLRVGALPPSGTAFVLLALASVSFDGLSRTFWWLERIGVNPLEFPGRSAVLGANSLGLVGTFAGLVAAYGAAVLLGRALARPGGRIGDSLSRYVVAIVPIAFGYHFAHYLPSFLIDIQYAARALSDPFALGWDLLGTSDLHVTASLLTDHRSITMIWYLQLSGIVLAHVLAVAIGHLLALRAAASRRQALLSQLPMAGLMIGYTLFGLWLLSTLVAG